MRTRSAAVAAALSIVLVGGQQAVAIAAPYPPPSSGSGTANPSRVKQGGCTNFSGDGFAADAQVAVYDDESRYGTAAADKKGGFKAKVCFANDADIGDHVVSGRGANAKTSPNDADQRVVSAVVTVVGMRESDPHGNDKVHGKKAASTSRTDAGSPFVLAAAGLLLLPFVTGLLLLLEQRHRRRRAS